MDSNSPLNKELKKNPQTFIDIKYILVNSTIYIFNKKNKNTLNIVFMKEENLYQWPIRSKQGSFASDKRVPGSDSTYIDSMIDWLIDWLRPPMSQAWGYGAFAYVLLFYPCPLYAK